MAASRARPAPVLAGMAVAAGLFLIGLSFAPDAEARTSCSYTGAPTNLLSVTASRDAEAEIRRRGEEIVVGEFSESPTACSGGVPTVLNTDTIKVLLRGLLTTVDLRLDGGPFAPGATTETEGASEIEIEVRGADAQGNVIGTRHADEFHWGPGGAQAGLNVNPGSAGDQDVDVTLRSELGFLVANGGAGDDTIIPAPGAVVRDAGISDGGRGDDLLIAPQNSGGILYGGSGDDVLTGGRPFDILSGDGGNDRVAGGGGGDRISGGRGRDLLLGGPGRDAIDARDSKRDRVRCGRGRDYVKADRRDHLRGCERVSLR